MTLSLFRRGPWDGTTRDIQDSSDEVVATTHDEDHIYWRNGAEFHWAGLAPKYERKRMLRQYPRGKWEKR